MKANLFHGQRTVGRIANPSYLGIAILLCGSLAAWLPSYAAHSPARGPQQPLVIDVFPGKAPGVTEIREDKVKGKQPTRSISQVTHPTLSVFRPAKEKDNGAAVVIAPGGGYAQLAWDHEGEDVATWLNGIGVTGIVLKYRVPLPKGQAKDQVTQSAHQDAQRAISLVRSKAKDWGIDTKRIGMLGFSAGGHLTAMTMTHFDERGYESIDEVDKVSCRPDFGVLVYPAYMLKGDELDGAIKVTKATPPALFVHAGDDMYLAEGSVRMYLALRKAGVASEMHIYTKGGHGFGMRKGNLPANQWPQRCEEWLRGQGFLKTAQ
jgi:acetyl esterase/lipase